MVSVTIAKSTLALILALAATYLGAQNLDSVAPEQLASAAIAPERCLLVIF